MKFDPDKLEKLGSFVQSIVTSIGIIAAGSWAFYTFNEIGTVQKAEAEIATLRQNAARQPVLQIGIKAEQISKDSDTKRLSVIATLKNEGNLPLSFDTPILRIADAGPTLTAQAQATATENKARFIDSDGTIKLMPEKRLMRAGQARSIVFLVTVPSAGSYLLQIEVSFEGGEFVDGYFTRGGYRNAKFTSAEAVPIIAYEQASVDVK